jgi:hypothetical protein
MNKQFVALDVLEQRLRVALAADAKLRLPDTPDFPLAFNVALPSVLPSRNGHIGIRFSDVAISGVEEVRIDAARSTVEGDRAVAWLQWTELRVDGHQSLVAKPAPVIRMDTGGSLLDYDDNDIRPAGAASVTPLDPAQQAAMLDQAREQRTRLMDHPNGVQLMSQYNEHNEVFNTVFVTSTAARTAWAAEGATKEMALHTHVAIDPNVPAVNIVNPPKDQASFGAQKISYNSNAFLQQLQIVVNTVSADPNFNPFDPDATPDPDSKYTKASLAALTFGSAVGQTGNSKAATTPLSPDQVHSSVQGGKPPPPASIDELNNVLQQGTQPGGAAAAVATARNWRVLDEQDRRLVRHQLYATAKERAERAIVQADTLWSGACGATISGAAARLEFELGDRTRLVSATVELPAFEFELDDSAWTGDAADIARERLAAVSFIRSLLRERIQTGLTEKIASAARAGLDDAA